MKIFFLMSLFMSNLAVAQFRCVDIFQRDSTLFQTLSTKIIEIIGNADNTEVNHLLDLALYSQGVTALPREGMFATRYYEATRIAADHGVLGPFLENLITVRFPQLKSLQSEEGWGNINSLDQADIERMIPRPRAHDEHVTTIEELSPQVREIVENAIIVLGRRLDKTGLHTLVLRTSIPLSSVEFNGPYRQIARSLMQQAVANERLPEVFLAIRKFFSDNRYLLPQEEKGLFESF